MINIIIISSTYTFDPYAGGLGDCWMLSALAVIAERPDLIRNLIDPSTTTDFRASGKATFRLFIDGDWKNIVVDNHLPCRVSTKKRKVTSIGAVGDELAYAKANQSQLWVPLLEKAYAKAHGTIITIYFHMPDHTNRI